MRSAYLCSCARLHGGALPQATQAVIDLEQQLRERQEVLERAQAAEREASAAEEDKR